MSPLICLAVFEALQPSHVALSKLCTGSVIVLSSLVATLALVFPLFAFVFDCSLMMIKRAVRSGKLIKRVSIQ